MRKFLSPLYALPITAAALIGLLLVSVFSHMGALASGTEIIVPARGYDPRDILLGHYVRLTPSADTTLDEKDGETIWTEFDLGERRWASATGWTVLENQNGSWNVVRVLKKRPDIAKSENSVALFGEIRFQRRKSTGESVAYIVTPPIDIDRYYANAREAKAIEDKLRDRTSDTPVRLILSVSKDGKAMLKGLEVDGERQVMSWW